MSTTTKETHFESLTEALVACRALGKPMSISFPGGRGIAYPWGGFHRLPTRPRCKVCGYRIRGANHAEGRHHKAKARKER